MLKFCRQRTFSYQFLDLEKAPLQRRGFLFDLSVGFQKEQNPLSGMTVDLVKVDAWLAEAVEKSGQNFSPRDLLSYFREFLAAKAQLDQAQVVSIHLHEERLGSWSWSCETDSCFFECSHFFECFHPAESALNRIYFQWQELAKEPLDLSQESLRILKASNLDSLEPMEETVKKLRLRLGDRLGKNHVLKRIRLESKDPQYVLVIERV